MKKANSKDTNAMKYFSASFKKWYEASGLNLVEAGVIFDLSHTFISKLLKRQASLSIGTAELIATKLDKDLIEMLIEGRRLLGEAPKKQKGHEDDPFAKHMSDYRYLLLFCENQSHIITRLIEETILNKQQIEADNLDPTKKQGFKSAS